MRIFNCRNCNKETPWRYSSTNIYCSNTCQREWQSKERVRQWLEEGKDWGLQIPQWVRKTLADLRGYKCEVCGVSEWNGQEIKLECDHIDGNHRNNVISNLRLICPNCHSQTDTYKAKNKGNGRPLRRKDFYSVGRTFESFRSRHFSLG